MTKTTTVSFIKMKLKVEELKQVHTTSSHHNQTIYFTLICRDPYGSDALMLINSSAFFL